jgi:restriction system protein
MDITFHYPPELLDLLVDTVPLLCKSKQNVITFFQGAGVGPLLYQDLEELVRVQRDSTNKYDITRTILVRLNQRGEAALRERREVLKRVTEFDAFTSCWPSDQQKAKWLVSDVRQLVNVKDSFTRMNIEREKEAQQRRQEHEAKLKLIKEKRVELEGIRSEMAMLVSISDPHRRGKMLETVLNRLFSAYGISLREAFTIIGANLEGIVEQIDGVIELDGSLYLVEMKWWNKPLGPSEVAQHLVRVFNRGHARGMFISASGFTPAAVNMCRDSLSKATVVLCDLAELVLLLEGEQELPGLLRRKVQAAVIDKNPWYRP